MAQPKPTEKQHGFAQPWWVYSLQFGSLCVALEAASAPSVTKLDASVRIASPPGAWNKMSTSIWAKDGQLQY